MIHVRGLLVLLLSVFIVAISSPVLAAQKIIAKIDISEQRMKVIINGRVRHSWPVSTARRGYRTPTGRFRPGRMYKRYYSRRYNGSPMPHSVFFYKGYAIHGTNHTSRLGQPASHGCVRLHPSNARRLYSMIRRAGKGNVRILVTR